MITEGKIEYTRRMHDALLFIQRSLDHDLAPEEVAATANFSLSHFHRIFKTMIGESLGEHIRRLRLERAAMRLVYSDQPVINVALDAGYETPESFSRAFRSMFGLAPTKYRERELEMIPDSFTGIHYQPGATVRPIELILPDIGATMDVKVEPFPQTRVAFIRHTGPYNEVYGVWDRLCAWAAPYGLLGPGTMFLGICYDHPNITEGKHIRYDAAISVPDTVIPEDEVGIQEVGGMDCAVYMHKGPYENLTETYDRLMMGWFPQSGYRPDPTPSYEVYLNAPEETPSEDLRTELHVPLRQS